MATAEGQALFEQLHTSAVQAGGRRPAAITAIDLPRLAALVGVSAEDLAGKLGDAHALQASGRVALPQESVAFEAPLPETTEAHVHTALLSVASRPSVLDSSQAPKVLMELGGEPVLVHVISQLAAGGIRRIVLVLGKRGSLIRSAIEAHAVSARLSIDYVDLGEGYNGGFARSLLEARHRISEAGPFLICTADHIFDAAIVRQLTADPLPPSLDAVALVERAAAAMIGLPPTVVRVRLERRELPDGPMHEEPTAQHRSPRERDSSSTLGFGSEPTPLISHIGKNVGAATDGIEAGLYLCSTAVFDALLSVSRQRNYFTLAQAMATIAAARRLGAVFTDGRAWFAIETHDQLELAARQVSSESAGRFPWQVRLARADSFSSFSDPRHAPSDLRLVLAVTAASTAMHALPNLQLPGAVVSAADEDIGLECGFSLVPVTSTAAAAADADAAGAEEPLTLPRTPRTKADGLVEPLLPLRVDIPMPSTGLDDVGMASPHASPLTSPLPQPTASSHPVAGSLGALDGDGTGDAALAMSIEVPQGEDTSHTAYLINVPEQQSGYILAVPHVQQRRDPGWLCGLTPELPSDVTAVRVEVGPSSRVASPQVSPIGTRPPFPSAQPLTQPAVLLTVEKSVPFSGWALLVYSIFASHSAGAIINVEIAAMPSAERHVFLRFAWRGMCASLVMGIIAIARHGRGAISTCDQLSGLQWARIVGAGLALFLNKALMAFTSVAHGALYDSTAPLWLVVGQLLRAVVGLRPAVPFANCAGALLGGVGSALAMIDDAPTSNSSLSHIELFADEMAVFSGLGSCLFLLLVEGARSRIDPTLFYALLQLQFMVYSLIAAFVVDDSPPNVSLDPLRGLFGWVVLSPGRFFAQMWLALVADYTGTVGFIVVMRYVPALVVATTLLFSPFFSWAEAMAIGQETVPGPWTMVGGSLVVVGCALIAAQAQHHSMSVEISPQVGELESVRAM